MPMVGKKKFPYTKKGKAEAKKYKDKNKKNIFGKYLPVTVNLLITKNMAENADFIEL